MKTDFTTLKRILEPNGQFEVPIYQRTYDWDKKHCKQFYDDVMKIGKDKQEQSHFIGAMTLVGEITMPDSDIGYYQVIDGQQRLTTLMLLLRALRESLDEFTEHVTEQKINQLLFNVNEREDGVNYHKLILTEDDDHVFKDIMKNGHSESSNNIITNYKYFISLLNKDEIKPDVVWRGIQRLTIVEILIGEKDNAQAIFESMNSTGLDLSATDMIQNYLLMSEDSTSQRRIYREYWSPMEKRFGEERDEDFDDFIRYYLSMHRGKAVTKKEMYEYFKIHLANNDKKKEIEKLRDYSKYYANLIGILPHTSKKLDKVIKYISSQETKNANSLLLRVLIDHADGIITEEECKKVFILVDSYLIRCYVCNLTKGENKVFPAIIPKIDKRNYVKSIEKELMLGVGNRKFPRDITFKENLERLPLYLNNTICKYMLVRLEYDENKEFVESDNLTIEHIMPQTLTDEWKYELGHGWEDIHEKYIDVIGNLTLTAYNSDIGNKPFSHKLDIYKKSKLDLNKNLTQYSSWTVNDIKHRTQRLTEQAVKIWQCPTGYYLDERNVEKIDKISEEEYLERTNVPEIWNEIKEKILSLHDGIEFKMTKVYGGFYIYGKSVICSLEVFKNKIKITYNIKFDDGILGASVFVRDVSNIGHYGVGDFSSVIMTEEDIDKAVEYVKIVYDHKIRTMN